MRGIYKIKNIINGKFYIGSSKDIIDRWKNHLWRLSTNQHGNPHLQSSFNTYGKDNFLLEVIEECLDGVSREEMLNIEQKWINSTCCLDREFGYNIRPKADCTEVSEETREKLRKRRLGKKATKQALENMRLAHTGCLNYMFGKHHCIETIEKMRKAQVGKHHSDETKNKISLAGKGRVFSKEAIEKMSIAQKNRHRVYANPMLGKHHSSESIEKMRLAHLGVKRTEQAKRNMRAAQQRLARINKEKIETAALALQSTIS